MELENIKKIVVNGQVYGIEDERARQMIAEEIAKVVGGAPETFDTLKEIADYIEVHGLDMAEIIAGVEANTQAVSEEASRAKAAEKLLEGYIAAEKARAEQAEKANATAISTEATRAKAAEKANADAIVAEKERAEKHLAVEVEKLKDGDTIVGQAREIHSRNGKTVTDSFLTRTTAGSGTIGDGVATLKSVGGNIVKNLVDGTFASGWKSQETLQIADEIAYITKGTAPLLQVTYTCSRIIGHRYYACVCAKSNGRVALSLNNLHANNNYVTPNDKWVILSVIGEHTNNTYETFVVREEQAENLAVCKPLLIDLTETFSAGNEPTKEECDKLFGTMDALPQGLTIANPTEFKSTGYNQADPSKVLIDKGIENGAIVDKVGSNLAVVPCLPCKIGEGENNGYCIHGAFDEGAENVYLTPLNPMEVEGELYLCELTKDVDKGTYVPQIKGYMLVEVPNAINLCVHFLWSEDRGRHDFEPYYESKVELPAIPEMSEYGLAGIQTSGTLACDEIDFEKGVYRKKIGAVDLGSLTITTSGTLFVVAKPDNISIPGYGKVCNAVIDRYSIYRAYTVTSNELGEKGYMVYTDGRLFIKDTTYTDVTSFKTAMQGVMLYYELAEPEEHPLPKVNNNYTSSDYGVEQFDGAVPCNANNLYYMRSLAGETRNFLDRMYANTGKEESPIALADYITEGIADNKAKVEEAPNLALRALFVAAGATYNADTKLYSLNGVTGLSESDIVLSYSFKDVVYRLNTPRVLQNIGGIKAFFPHRGTVQSGQVFKNAPLNGMGTFSATSLEIIRVNAATTNLNETNLTNILPCSGDVWSATFLNCSKLREVWPINVTNVPRFATDTFKGTPLLVELRLYGLSNNIEFSDSRVISKASILYIVNNAVPKTSAITITLHPDAFARLSEDADIVAALTAQPLVTLVSA